MKKQGIILHPKQKSVNAPEVSLDTDRLIIIADANEEYNYATSTDYGSVMQKGTFLHNIELQLETGSASNLIQLDLFNASKHFTYNFIVG